MWEYNYYADNELYHHGIKGMKWGVRRTPAQLGHDTGGVDLQKAKKKVEAANTIVNESQNINRKVSGRKQRKMQKQQVQNAKAMTDQELRERVNRLNMEQQYARLSAEQMSAGKVNVDRVLSEVGTVVALTNSVLAIALAVQKLK